MSGWDDRTLLEDLLARGVDDWIYAAEVYDIIARTELPDPAQLRMLAIGLIAEAIVRGLVLPGEFDGAEHRPWDCSRGEAIARIQEEWLEWGADVPTPGAIVWLDITPAGREIGEAVLARERRT
jgi:hypothetical protein